MTGVPTTCSMQVVTHASAAHNIEGVRHRSGYPRKKNILAKCLPEKKTPGTIMPGTDLDSALKVICSQGFCEDHGESSECLFRVGLPVFDRDNRMYGAVSASWTAPSFNTDKAALIRDELAEIVEAISCTLTKRSK